MKHKKVEIVDKTITRSEHKRDSQTFDPHNLKRSSQTFQDNTNFAPSSMHMQSMDLKEEPNHNDE